MKKEGKIVESAASSAKLRKKAEGVARGKKVMSPANMDAMSPKEIRQTLHELRVHQIELDMQNEALRQTQAELVAERARFFDLYNTAPVGYLTLNEKGLIQDANLTAANLLGMAQKSLLGQLLARFIPQDDQDIYYRHRKNLWETDAPQSWEMRLVKKGGSAFWAHLEATNAQDSSTGALRPDSVLAGQAGGSELRIAFSDITSYKWAVDELRKSDERYQNIFDNANEAIFVVQDGKIVFTNPMTATISGYSAEEFAPRTFVDFIHPDDQDMLGDRYARRMKGEELSHIYSFRIIHKDGSIRWVELNAVLIEWKGSTATLNFLSDITDRKRSEQAIMEARNRLEQEVTERTAQLQQEIEQRKVMEKDLRESEEKHRIILEESSDPIFSFTPEGQYRFANLAFAQCVGKTPEDIIGKTIWDVFPQDEADKRFAALSQVFLTGEEKIIEVIVPGANGERHYITTINPVKNDGGEILTAICSSKDITARKLAEESLWKSRQRLQSLVDTLYDLIWEVDPQGNFTYISPRIKDTLGYEQEEVLGKTPFSMMSAAEAKRVSEIFVSLAAEHKPIINLQNINLHKDGHSVIMETSGLPFYDSNGEFKGYQGTDRDITARKLAENKMIAVNSQMEKAMLQAKEATLVKSRFLATMSHEIRTPLSALIGMTGLLLETPLTDKQRHYTQKINTSGETLLSLLNNILDYSKIESGKITLENLPFSLGKVIDTVVNIFEQRAKEKGISLSSTIDPELPASVLGGPHQLTQVISNLVANAVKFTEAGEIELAVKVRKQSAAEVELEISVRDTGIGMTKEEMSRLFQAFSQADSSTTRRFGGSGLGLAISKQLVELRQGTIRVESTPGKGSIFTVALSFPIAAETLVADLPINPVLPRMQFSGVRALVAEDHEINREIIVELLRQAGIEADIAKTGREAVEMVRAQDYDILFMDIEMPEMDGLAATREIRHLGRKSAESMPILAMTAYALTGDREKSLAAGMSDHLTKPISPGALGKALRQWLPRGKYAVQKPDFVIEQDMTNTSAAQSLDVEEGLNRLGGNSKLYLKLLRDFIDGYGKAPEQLLQDLRLEQREEALHLVHAIRGIAGNLGGKELAAAATELEKALRKAENSVPFSIGEHLRLFTDRHEALITAIGSVLVRHQAVEPVKAEGPPGDLAQLRLEMERLKVFLKNKEPLPCQEILETLLQSRWPDNYEVTLVAINRLVSNYRMMDALELLEKKYNNP